MISATYLLSGALLAVSAWLFDAGVLHAAAQTFIWIVVFFFASAGASAGYLTVSEIFPIEIRAEALAVFFAIAQIFGAIGPVFYGVLIGNGTNRTGLTIGYIVGGGIMIIGGAGRDRLRDQCRGQTAGAGRDATDRSRLMQSRPGRKAGLSGRTVTGSGLRRHRAGPGQQRPQRQAGRAPGRRRT